MTGYVSPILTLRDQAVAYLRSQWSQKEVATIKSYGGRFTEAEIEAKSFLSPAIFVAVLGWAPVDKGRRLSGKFVRRVYLAAFVIIKAVDRETRGDQAMALSDEVGEVLRQWHPDVTGLDVDIGPLEEDPEIENLYSRKADEIGVARWLVKWDQTVFGKTRKKTPNLYPMTEVDITDTVRSHVPDATTQPPAIVVKEEVDFVQVDPAS